MARKRTKKMTAPTKCKLHANCRACTGIIEDAYMRGWRDGRQSCPDLQLASIGLRAVELIKAIEDYRNR